MLCSIQDILDNKEDTMAVAIVEVVSTPAGEAPEAVRKAWLGCSFAAIFFSDTPSGGVGVESGQQTSYRGGNWGVTIEKAIEALEYKKKERNGDEVAIGKAIVYWKNKHWPPGTMLMFQEHECKVLA